MIKTEYLVQPDITFLKYSFIEIKPPTPHSVLCNNYQVIFYQF